MTTNSEISEKMQKNYLKGNYKTTIDQLLEHKESFEPALFHYNLGTLYLKNKQFAPARFHLEKGIQNGFSSKAANKNLSIVLQNLEIKTGHNFWANELFLIPNDAFTCFSLAFLIFIVLFLKKLIRKKYLLIFLFFIALTPQLFKNFYLDKHLWGIGLEKINIYEGPSRIFQQIGHLKKGSKVLIEKTNGPWYFISYPESHIGWIKKEQIGIY